MSTPTIKFTRRSDPLSVDPLSDDSILKFQVSPDVREYSLSAASMGNSLGTNIAAFLSIPLYNWVCGMKAPHR